MAFLVRIWACIFGHPQTNIKTKAQPVTKTGCFTPPKPKCNTKREAQPVTKTKSPTPPKYKYNTKRDAQCVTKTESSTPPKSKCNSKPFAYSNKWKYPRSKSPCIENIGEPAEVTSAESEPCNSKLQKRQICCRLKSKPCPKSKTCSKFKSEYRQNLELEPEQECEEDDEEDECVFVLSPPKRKLKKSKSGNTIIFQCTPSGAFGFHQKDGGTSELIQNSAGDSAQVDKSKPVESQAPRQNKAPVQNQDPLKTQAPGQNQAPLQNRDPVQNQAPGQNRDAQNPAHGPNQGPSQHPASRTAPGEPNDPGSRNHSNAPLHPDQETKVDPKQDQVGNIAFLPESTCTLETILFRVVSVSIAVLAAVPLWPGWNYFLDA